LRCKKRGLPQTLDQESVRRKKTIDWPVDTYEDAGHLLFRPVQRQLQRDEREVRQSGQAADDVGPPSLLRPEGDTGVLAPEIPQHRLAPNDYVQ